MLVDLKVEPEQELISNYADICKEILVKSLRNKARRISDPQGLFDAMAILSIEGSKADKDKKRNLTNLLLRHTLSEMRNYIISHVELGLYMGYELDYIFFSLNTITEFQLRTTAYVASKFGEKILKEEKFYSSNLKKKMNSTQKMLLDDLIVLNALKSAYVAACLMVLEIKENKLIYEYQDEKYDLVKLGWRKVGSRVDFSLRLGI